MNKNPDNTPTISSHTTIPEIAHKTTSNFLAAQQSKGDLLAGRPLITATTTTNNNNTFFLENNTNDPPPFNSNLSQNWAGGASNIKSISNAYNTNDPPPFSSNLSQNWAGCANTILPSQVNDPLTLCAGEMFPPTGKYLDNTPASRCPSPRLNLDTTPSLQVLHNQEGESPADSRWPAPRPPSTNSENPSGMAELRFRDNINTVLQAYATRIAMRTGSAALSNAAPSRLADFETRDAVVDSCDHKIVTEKVDTSQVTKHRRRSDGNHQGKHAERLAMAERKGEQPQAATENGAHPQVAIPAYTGSKYNTQEISATELLCNLETDGASEHGGKVLHAGGPAETTDDAALHPTKQISQPLDLRIPTLPPPAALAEPPEVTPVGEASGTQVTAPTASIKKLEIEQLWEQILVYGSIEQATDGLAAVGLERLKELLTFSDFCFHAELGRAEVIPLVYRRVNMGCDYDVVRENGMNEARMRLRQMSLNELEKLADRHAQGDACDNGLIRWSGLMERFRLGGEIGKAEANEDILEAVLLEWGIKGSSGRGTGEVIGTAPPAQAGGAGHADARVGQAAPAAPRQLRISWHSSTRRGAEDLKNRQSPPLRDPLHERAQASPRAHWLRSGNRFAVLSDLPEQEEGHSEEVPGNVKAEEESAGKTVARNRGPHRTGNYGQPRLPHPVSLGDFLPADLSRTSKRRNRAGHRRRSREEVSERIPLAFDERGKQGTVTENVPCGFRSTFRPRDERPLVVRVVERVHFNGMLGVVSEHVPAQPKGLRGRRSYGRRSRAQPRPVQKADPALRASSPLVGIRSILSRPAPVVVTEPAPEAQSGLPMTTAGEEIRRGTLATMSTAAETDSPAGTGRLRVVVQLDGKTRLEVEAREEEWSIASGLGRSEEQAADWAVARGLNRALNKPRGETARLQPILNGDLVFGEHRPGSWESLAAFVRKGGAYRLIQLLRGGMDPAAQDPVQGCVLGPNLDWTALDLAYSALQEGPAPPDPLSDEQRLAQRPFASVTLTQMDLLRALPEKFAPRLNISAVRVAALQCAGAKPVGDTGGIPTWVQQDRFIEVRLNLIEVNSLIDGGNPQDLYSRMQEAIRRELERACPELALALDWSLFRQECRIDMDNKSPGKFVGAVFVLPVGAWIGGLLRGHLAVTPLSYLTVQPRQGFCEVMLEKEDSQMLRAIGLSVRHSEKRYCEMLNWAFRVAYDTEFVTTRFVTAKVTIGGKGKQRKTTHLEPNSPDAELAVGIDVMSVIVKSRHASKICLSLGCQGETPVQVIIGCLRCPRRSLYEMVDVSAQPFRLRTVGGMVDSVILVYGPLVKGALSEARTACQRTEARERLKRLGRELIQAQDISFLNHYRAKPGGPVCLYLEFSSVRAAQDYVDAGDAGTLPPAFLSLVQPFIHEEAATFSCWAPAEALEVLKDTDLLKLFENGKLRTCLLPPPRHPPPDVVVQAA